MKRTFRSPRTPYGPHCIPVGVAHARILGACLPEESRCLTNPLLYTEDGAWSALLYREGLAAYWKARPDYLVVGNIVLLHFAIGLNEAFFSAEGILKLPQMIAGVSYGFFGAVAALPFVALRGYMPAWARVAVCLTVLLLPMGGHVNEMLGRLSNVGYSFTYIAILLILWREKVPRWGRWVLSGLLVVCCATNPLVFAPLGLYLLWRMWETRLRLCADDFALGVGSALLLGWTLYSILTAAERPVLNDAELSTSSFIVVAIARSILYPLAFPFYHSFDSLRVWTAPCSSGRSDGRCFLTAPTKAPYGFVLVSLSIVTVAVWVQRPELMFYLGGFQLSFPDRYFYAQNLLVLLALVWAAAILVENRAALGRALGAAAGTTVLAVYVLNAPFLIESDRRAPTASDRRALRRAVGRTRSR